MTHIVQDLLTLSRFDSGKDELHLVRFPFDVAVQDLYNAVYMEAQRHDHKMKLRLEPDLPTICLLYTSLPYARSNPCDVFLPYVSLPRPREGTDIVIIPPFSPRVKKKPPADTQAAYRRKSGSATFSNQDACKTGLDSLRKSRPVLHEKCYFRRTCRRK